MDDITGANGDVILTHNYHYSRMISEHLGIAIISPSSEQIDNILNSVEFEEMEVWPSASSVKIINDVMVVKLYNGY